MFGVDNLYKIGELAKLAGVNKSLIDHYTREGLIEPAKRSSCKYRLYSQEALDRIKFVMKCKDKRLSLAEIQEAIKREQRPDMAEIKLCMEQMAAAVDEALGELKNIDLKLEGMSETELSMLRDKANVLMIKVLAISELLQIVLRQV